MNAILKTVAAIAVVASISPAHAQLKTLEVRYQADVAKETLEVACVQSINSEGEGNGRYLFYSGPSFARAEALKKQGLTATQLVDANCKTLTSVLVPERAKRTDIEKEIAFRGGFKSATVVFFNSDQLEEIQRKALLEALHKL